MFTDVTHINGIVFEVPGPRPVDRFWNRKFCQLLTYPAPGPGLGETV